jgi:hypothetical protein
MEDLVDLVLGLNKEFSKEIPEINAGGCGVFALHVSKELRKLGYSPNIVIITNMWEQSLEIKKRVLNNVMNRKPAEGNKSETSFAHCCIEVDGLYFDALQKGAALEDKWRVWYKFSGTYTEEEMELALKIGGWNSRYSRRKRNPTLRKIIRRECSKLISN